MAAGRDGARVLEQSAGGRLLLLAKSYWTLASASIREQMSYRRSFLLEMLGKLIGTGIELIALLLLFERVESIGGWSKWEVVYLYGVASISLGIAELLTTGLDAMPELVRTGTMDGILIRPVPPLLQILGRDIRLLQLGRLIQGMGALAVALVHLPVAHSPEALLLLLIAMISTTAIYFGLFLAAGASCFWTVQSSELFNAFTYGGVQMTQFPISVYPRWLRDLFLFAVPLGFTSYVPAVEALGKEAAWARWLDWIPGVEAGGMSGIGSSSGAGASGGSLAPGLVEMILPWMAPVVAAVFLYLCLRFWRLGLNHYQGAGS